MDTHDVDPVLGKPAGQGPEGDGMSACASTGSVGMMDHSAEDRIVVLATWDSEAAVWTASSEDVTGLAIEADTIDDLERLLDEIIPELLNLNETHQKTLGPGLLYRLLTQRDRTIPNAALVGAA